MMAIPQRKGNSPIQFPLSAMNTPANVTTTPKTRSIFIVRLLIALPPILNVLGLVIEASSMPLCYVTCYETNRVGAGWYPAP